MSETEGRILFMCPDTRIPYGGVKMIYTMVDILHSLGFNSFVWHAKRNFGSEWFDNDTRTIHAKDLRINKADVLVVPEDAGINFAALSREVNVVILNQNHFHVFQGAGLTNRWPGNYPGWPNAVAVIITSDAIQAFVSRCLISPLPTYRVPYWIDGELFKPGTKRKTITLLNRRRLSDVEAIIQLLHRSPFLTDWNIVPLENMDHNDLATSLNESAIFVSLSDHEGFGLPPAEAMASGNFVVGFSGDGGSEFMFPEFCYPANDPNIVQVIEAVERAAQLFEEDPDQFRATTMSARDFIIERYSRGALEASLFSCFSDLTRVNSTAHQLRPTTLRHYSSLTVFKSKKEALRQLKAWVPPIFWHFFSRFLSTK